MIPKVTSNAQEFAETFAEYRRLSRKVPGEALAHRAGRMSMRLHEEFKALRPNVIQIVSAARARGYRVRRQGNELTKTQDGLSAAAVERARTLLAGKESEYFRVTDFGVPQVRPARVGVRNGNKLLGGGRYGNKFADSARSVSQLPDDQIQRLRAQNADLKRLNLRALSVAIELAYRFRAGKGGLLALQFLHGVYKTRKSSVVKRGPLITRTRGGVGIGSVTFENEGPDGDVSAVTIRGNVPGTEKINRAHDVTGRAIVAETADMRVYVQRKLEEAQKGAGLK